MSPRAWYVRAALPEAHGGRFFRLRHSAGCNCLGPQRVLEVGMPLFSSNDSTPRSFTDSSGRMLGGALRRPVLLLTGVLLALAALAPAAQAAPFAYVANRGVRRRLPVRRRAEPGRWRRFPRPTAPADNSPIPGCGEPGRAERVRRELRRGNVSQYDVGTGGPLTPKTPATVAAGTNPIGVAVSPDGLSVYVANRVATTSPSTTSAAAAS